MEACVDWPTPPRGMEGRKPLIKGLIRLARIWLALANLSVRVTEQVENRSPTLV